MFQTERRRREYLDENLHQKHGIVWTPYIMLIPTLVLLGVFTFFPFIKTIVLSFFLTNAQGKAVKFVGFQNFIRILPSKSFLNSLWLTIKFALVVGVGTFVISMFLSLLCTNIVRGSRVYEVMYTIPMAIASAPASIIWFFILTPGTGVLNSLLHTKILWLSNPKIAIYTIAMVTIWASIGVSVIFLMTGFRNVPAELQESAIIDGATKLQRIKHILIPVASPQIFFVIFLNIVNSFRAFAQIRLLTNGGPMDSTSTLIYSLYNMAFHDNRFESACVLSLVLFLIIFLVTRIQFLFEHKVNY